MNLRAKGRQDTSIFETREVLLLTGIPSIYLNKFIEYRSFGIAPSIRKGSGRGSRRLFSTNDVLGIALVWALFRLGLRSKFIGQVLAKARAIPTLEGLATDAATSIAQSWGSDHEGPHVLVIRRWLGQKQKKGRELQVFLESPDYEARSSDFYAEVIIPVHLIFGEVQTKIQKLGLKARP